MFSFSTMIMILSQLLYLLKPSNSHIFQSFLPIPHTSLSKKSSKPSEESYLLKFKGGYEPTPYDRRSERGTIDIDTDMGKTGSIVLGKDRVLVQFNMDLKWIYLLITDKNEWSKTFEKFITFLQTNCIHRFSKKKILKKEILYILSDIRFKNPTSTYPLKCFYGTLEETLQYSFLHNKLLLMYIEDGYGEFPTQFSSTFRRALSNSKVSHLINENFVFYAVTTKSHYYFKKIYQMYSKLPKFPILLVITPFDISITTTDTAATTITDITTTKTSSSSDAYKKNADINNKNINKNKTPSLSLLEICNKIENNLFAAVLLPPPELNGENILHFLHSILDNLGISYNSNSFFKDSLNFLKASASSDSSSGQTDDSSDDNSDDGDGTFASDNDKNADVSIPATTATSSVSTDEDKSYRSFQYNNDNDDDYDVFNSPTSSSSGSHRKPNNSDNNNSVVDNRFPDLAHLFFPKKQ